ncbi:hypothetical protein GCM10028786_06050 [Flaviaesturariibacter terrae]
MNAEFQHLDLQDLITMLAHAKSAFETAAAQKESYEKVNRLYQQFRQLQEEVNMRTHSPEEK